MQQSDGSAPPGYHTVTPYLLIKGAGQAIEFYREAFGATEVFRLPGPNESIGHAEIKVGDSRIMLADEYPEMGFEGPQTLNGTSVYIHLYVEDVDAVFDNAIHAGAKTLRPVEDQFYGDRSGSLVDPFGHVWYIATHKEDVGSEELQTRAAEVAASEEAE